MLRRGMWGRLSGPDARLSASPLQEEDLRQIFVLTVEVLQEFSRRDSLSAHMSSVFQRYLALANQVLSWNFLPPNHILYLRAPPWCWCSWLAQA